jgi:hypothetical protein
VASIKISRLGKTLWIAFESLNQISLADIGTVEEKSNLLKNALSLTLTRKSLRLWPRLKFHYWKELKSVLRFLINHLFNLFQIEKCNWFESLKPVFSKFQTQTSDTKFFNLFDFFLILICVSFSAWTGSNSSGRTKCKSNKKMYFIIFKQFFFSFKRFFQ